MVYILIRAKENITEFSKKWHEECAEHPERILSFVYGLAKFVS